MTKREELARVLRKRYGARMGYDLDDWEDIGGKQDDWLQMVDAILDALMEPSETMLNYGHAAGVRKDAFWDTISYEQSSDLRTKYLPSAWQAMLKAVKDG